MTAAKVPEVLKAAQVARSTRASASLVQDLMDRGSLVSADDVAALRSLVRQNYDEAEILAWAPLGRMRNIEQALSLGVSREIAAAIPRADHGQHLQLVAMLLRRADDWGMDREDVPLWVRGGIANTVAPFLKNVQWQQWRAVGATAIGMRTAALACAAGLSPDEAREQIASGAVTRESLELLAALNG